MRSRYLSHALVRRDQPKAILSHEAVGTNLGSVQVHIVVIDAIEVSFDFGDYNVNADT